MKFTMAPEVLAFLESGVSIIVASRDATLRANLVRAVGIRVEPGEQAMTVFVSRSQAKQLLQDLAVIGQIAVVFSHPTTARGLQVKSSRVEVGPATSGDEPVLARYVAHMEREIALVGFPPTFTRAMLACRLEDVVAIRFEPEQAFDQTPGERAGSVLRGPA